MYRARPYSLQPSLHHRLRCRLPLSRRPLPLFRPLVSVHRLHRRPVSLHHLPRFNHQASPPHPRQYRRQLHQARLSNRLALLRRRHQSNFPLRLLPVFPHLLLQFRLRASLPRRPQSKLQPHQESMFLLLLHRCLPSPPLLHPCRCRARPLRLCNLQPPRLHQCPCLVLLRHQSSRRTLLQRLFRYQLRLRHRLQHPLHPRHRFKPLRRRQHLFSCRPHPRRLFKCPQHHQHRLFRQTRLLPLSSSLIHRPHRFNLLLALPRRCRCLLLHRHRFKHQAYLPHQFRRLQSLHQQRRRYQLHLCQLQPHR